MSAADEDIIAWDGQDGFSLHFDGSDVGLSKLVLDAVAVISSDEILISFSKAGSVPDIGAVDDSDIVKFTASSLGEVTSGSFSLYFDGSDVGLTQPAEDVDAVELLPDGRLLISTTYNFSVPGLSGKDTDLIEFTPISLGENTDGTWAIYFDGSDVGIDRRDEDVDGLAVNSAGDVYLSVVRKFSVAGLEGLDEDVFVCNSPTIGADTSCLSFTLMFDGSLYGLTNNDILAIDLP